MHPNNPYSRSPPAELARPSTASEDIQGPPRKKMRKGTKSCLGCRKRKIRCTLEPGSPGVCRECRARGSPCLDQEHGDPRAAYPASDQVFSLRERVAHLEGLVKEALHRRTEGGDGVSSADPIATDDQPADALGELQDTSASSPRETPLALPGGLREDAPPLSLFDNAVIARKDELPQFSRQRHNKHKAVAQVLRALLPAPRTVDIILEASSNSWNMWLQLLPELADTDHEAFKAAVSRSLQSESPAEVARMIICIAICIDQLPGDWDSSRLHLDCSSHELMERYMAKVDQLVTADDEIAGTLAGVECMCLQSKHYINVGRPRRAWLVASRAISFAQLLGVHRVAVMKPSQPDKQWKRQMSIWTHLFLGDRYLALILGLPLTIQSRFCDPLIPSPGQPTEFNQAQVAFLRTSSIMARIVDRNQSSQLDLSSTIRIDEEMEELAASVPQDWWGQPDAPAPSQQEHSDRLLCHFFFHATRKLLHLPFMLKLQADSRYQYSYSAALDASREMVRGYHRLRGSSAVVPYICKMVDFEAFCAAVLILLHLLGDSRGAQSSSDQDQSDSALIDTTIEILGEASKEAGGIVAEQSLNALEMLAEARHCTREHHGSQNSIKLSIPYFGTITLKPGSNFRRPQQGTFSRRSLKRPQAGSRDPLCLNTEPPAAAAAAAAATTATTPAITGLPTPPSASALSSQSSPQPCVMTEASSRSAPASILPSPYSTTNNLSYPPAPQQRQQQQQQQQQQRQRQAPPTNSITDFMVDYPLISFDSYTAVPPLGSDMGFGAGTGTGMDPLYPYGGGAQPSLDADAGSALSATDTAADEGATTDATAGSGSGPAFAPPWFLNPALDLDSSWNWIGLDGLSAQPLGGSNYGSAGDGSC